ncbi:uncharacterized protein MYCFIDRAFT_173421 [Pseudocercospora fijiensis CIRAD86]|uniref:Uncharacterized protein n=1 Tax=Pseudocercospora fijiensis (strain CIRAD86) TaxID=383855 RepID=M3B507_PSEFD|nr:uncharacterized protein MYCFIDRAFT_173421 [Pseudocercospora fijiensis CIRAD86]EME84427.1 hypothetical protein MYCFIDRAFT_173421 [Pseudocercospora fijiensis CIRAD86]
MMYAWQVHINSTEDTAQRSPQVFASQPDSTALHVTVLNHVRTKFINLGAVHSPARDGVLIRDWLRMPLAGRDFLAKLRQTLAARIVISPFSPASLLALFHRQVNNPSTLLTTKNSRILPSKLGNQLSVTTRASAALLGRVTLRLLDNLFSTARRVFTKYFSHRSTVLIQRHI